VLLRLSRNWLGPESADPGRLLFFAGHSNLCGSPPGYIHFVFCSDALNLEFIEEQPQIF
jgi:hypothetical protein